MPDFVVNQSLFSECELKVLNLLLVVCQACFDKWIRVILSLHKGDGHGKEIYGGPD
jgi:hypothetical protein